MKDKIIKTQCIYFMIEIFNRKNYYCGLFQKYFNFKIKCIFCKHKEMK